MTNYDILEKTNLIIYVIQMCINGYIKLQFR